MTRVTLAIIGIGLGSLLGGCKSDDNRRAQVIDPGNGTAYVDTRTVVTTDTPAATAYSQDNFWSNEEPTAPQIYAYPRDIEDDRRDYNRLEDNRRIDDREDLRDEDHLDDNDDLDDLDD